MNISNNIALCRSINRINSQLICYGYATVNAGWHGRVESPVFSRLYLITDGYFTIKGNDNQEFTLKKGSWYLLPTGYSFTYECAERMEHFYTHVKLCDLDGTDILRHCSTPLCLTTNEYTPEAIIELTQSNHIADGLMLKQTITKMLLNFITEYDISVSTEDYSPIVYNAINYIKNHLSMQLTIPEIAADGFISRSTLTKHFKSELSMSVNEYICNTVMSEAERLLTTTDISVLELSQKLGFSDQFYFSRRFKEKFGKCPREYRKKQLL